MKRQWFFASAFVVAGLAAGAGFVLEPARAQPAAAAPFYVIDINEVFKGYGKFTRETEKFKKELEVKENQLKSLDSMRRAKEGELRNKNNPADRDRLEKDIVGIKLELDQKKRKYQMELTQQEAKLYAEVYKEVTERLKQYCEHNKIPLVLRKQEVVENQGNPQLVLAQLKRVVVYNDPAIDLTSQITKWLNEIDQQQGAK